MRQHFTLSLVTVIVALIILYATSGVTYYQNPFNLVYVKSTVDGVYYRVRKDVPDPGAAADTLAKLRRGLLNIIPHLDFQTGDTLRQRLRLTEFMENPLKKPNSKFTSYTINKGEQIVLCLRDPVTRQIHEFDRIMYVMVHEAAHVVCPENGHTPFFRTIFAQLLLAAIKSGVLIKTDYRSQPMEYCGISITERII